jgi:hypothetical protein
MNGLKNSDSDIDATPFSPESLLGIPHSPTRTGNPLLVDVSRVQQGQEGLQLRSAYYLE